MKFVYLLCLFLGGLNLFSQEAVTDSLFTDSGYREDQFYIAAAYNLLIQQPKGVSQYNFSRSFWGGFIRDFPLNRRRNVALGVGVGYGHHLVFTNIGYLGENDLRVVNQTQMAITKNYFRFHSIDFPIELRFRTSTPISHKFWRFYTGFKPSFYIVGWQYTQSATKNTEQKVPSLGSVWGVNSYFSVGYNTWNVFVQYGFRPFLKGEKSALGQNLEMPMLQIGIIFYIL